MDELRIGQLMKEMVAEELRLRGDPCAAAAAVVRKTLLAALPGRPEGTPPGRVIEDAVKGTMTALLLADHDLVKGAIEVLEAVLHAADQAHVHPSEAMPAALKGIADLGRFVEPVRLDEIRSSIDARYMGAGQIFAEFLEACDAPAPDKIKA